MIKKVCKYNEKIDGKKSQSRMRTSQCEHAKNRIFDFVNSGGSVKCERISRGGSSKVYFVDKGEGIKNRQKCVYVFYGRPQLPNCLMFM